MENTLIEYIAVNWKVLLSIGIKIAICYYALVLILSFIKRRPIRFAYNEPYEQYYFTGDVVISREHAKDVMDSNRGEIASAKMWVIVDFHEGAYNAVNFTFGAMHTVFTNNDITLFQRNRKNACDIS